MKDKQHKIGSVIQVHLVHGKTREDLPEYFVTISELDRVIFDTIQLNPMMVISLDYTVKHIADNIIPVFANLDFVSTKLITFNDTSNLSEGRPSWVYRWKFAQRYQGVEYRRLTRKLIDKLSELWEYNP